MGFGLIEELQKLGYRPAQKCKATVMERPLTVSTAEFARISGLKIGHVQVLCAQGLIPCVRVGQGGRYKYRVEWETALEWLRDSAECGALLSYAVGGTKPVTTVDLVKKIRNRKSRRKKGVDYRRLPDDVLAKKKLLKSR